jgi:hypothetical protein
VRPRQRSAHRASGLRDIGSRTGGIRSRHGKVQYESKDDAGHKFWTARYGRYAIRIDAKQPGLYRWMITFDGRAVRKGTAPSRDEAADAVHEVLEELPNRVPGPPGL